MKIRDRTCANRSPDVLQHELPETPASVALPQSSRDRISDATSDSSISLLTERLSASDLA